MLKCLFMLIAIKHQNIVDMALVGIGRKGVILWTWSTRIWALWCEPFSSHYLLRTCQPSSIMMGQHLAWDGRIGLQWLGTCQSLGLQHSNILAHTSLFRPVYGTSLFCTLYAIWAQRTSFLALWPCPQINTPNHTPQSWTQCIFGWKNHYKI